MLTANKRAKTLLFMHRWNHGKAGNMDADRNISWLKRKHINLLYLTIKLPAQASFKKPFCIPIFSTCFVVGAEKFIGGKGATSLNGKKYQ